MLAFVPSPFTLDVAFLWSAIGYIEECFVFSGPCEHAFSVRWDGTLTLNYVYDAVNSLPTPSSLLLVGVGLAALGMSRRGSRLLVHGNA